MKSDYDIKYNYILPIDTKYWVYDSKVIKLDALEKALIHPTTIAFTLLTIVLALILIIEKDNLKKITIYLSTILLTVTPVIVVSINYMNTYHKLNKDYIMSKYYPTNQSFWSGDFSSGEAEAAAIPNFQPIVKDKNTYNYLEGHNSRNKSYIYKYSIKRPNKYYKLKDFNGAKNSNIYFEAGEIDQSEDLSKTISNTIKNKQNAIKENFLKGKRMDIYADKPDYEPYKVKNTHKLCKSSLKSTKRFNNYEIRIHFFKCIDYRN